MRSDQARTTLDVDLQAIDIQKDSIHQELQNLLNVDVGDYFSFQLQNPVDLPGETNSKRFAIVALLDGRKFEQFHILEWINRVCVGCAASNLVK